MFRGGRGGDEKCLTDNAQRRICDLCFAACLGAASNPPPNPSDDDTLAPDDLERLCKLLDVDPVKGEILVFLWQCKAKKMGYLTRAEFHHGLCASPSIFETNKKYKEPEEVFAYMREVKKPLWQQTLRNISDLSGVYDYTFGFALAEGQKELPLSLALAYWELLLFPVAEKIPQIKDWVDYMKEKGDTYTAEIVGKKSRAPEELPVSKDTWQSILRFLKIAGKEPTTFQTFDPNESVWPNMIDEFVTWYARKQHPQASG